MASCICRRRRRGSWLAEYLHELTVFPKGKHDDQVDWTAQMLDWFKRGGQEPQDWMWQMYKQAQARGPKPCAPRAAIGDGKEARHLPAAVLSAARANRIPRHTSPPISSGPRAAPDIALRPESYRRHRWRQSAGLAPLPNLAPMRSQGRHAVESECGAVAVGRTDSM